MSSVHILVLLHLIIKAFVELNQKQSITIAKSAENLPRENMSFVQKNAEYYIKIKNL